MERSYAGWDRSLPSSQVTDDLGLVPEMERAAPLLSPSVTP